jgi:hypothetical protein
VPLNFPDGRFPVLILRTNNDFRVAYHLKLLFMPVRIGNCLYDSTERSTKESRAAAGGANKQIIGHDLTLAETLILIKGESGRLK